MKELVLENSDRVAFVDDEDLERLLPYKWYLGNNRNGYAYGYFGNNKKILLHRYILGLSDSLIQVDHKNHNTLDCRKSEMRLCTNQENARNRKPRTVGVTSKFKGVSWENRVKKWRVTIFLDYKQIHIGTFTDEQEAARAYDKKAQELFGEFARLNFPGEHNGEHDGFNTEGSD